MLRIPNIKNKMELMNQQIIFLLIVNQIHLQNKIIKKLLKIYLKQFLLQEQIQNQIQNPHIMKVSNQLKKSLFRIRILIDQ